MPATLAPPTTPVRQTKPRPVPPPPLPHTGEPSVDDFHDAPSFTPPPQPCERERVRFTVRQFEVLAALGMLPNHIELVDGEIYAMPATGNGHSVCRSDLNEAFAPKWTRPRFVRSQDTHRFADGWAPEPDVALLLERPVQGAKVDPPLALVVEIAYQTLDYDLGEKSLRYARHEVPEYWVCDLVSRVIRVFRGPIKDATAAGAAWRETFVVGPGGRLSPLCIPDLDLDVDAVLPAAGVAGE